ncbi:MAG TPA: FtsX-like permease family protein [Thermoplasmata archaeon]|nr:FtsX-like permease family protein [Thermoplasmata archaeon]
MSGGGWGRGLRHARLQRILAVAAIGAAVALPVVLVSVGGGVAAHELHALQTSGYQLVVSAPGNHGVENAHNLTRAIQGIAGVAVASPVLSIAVDAFNAAGNVSPVLAEGIVPAAFTATLGPTDGSLFPAPLPLGDPNDTVHFANGTYAGPATDDLVVSIPFAHEFHLAVGDTLRLAADDNVSSAVPFHVTATFGPPVTFLEPAAAYAILLPLSDLQTLTGYASGPGTVVPDAADSIEVAVAPSIADNAGALAGVAEAIAALVPSYSVSTLSQEVSALESASAVLTGFYLALSSVGIAVGVIFLALVLLRRVETDRRSIGIRRALGVPGRAVAAGIVADGAGLAAGGAFAGVVGGIVLVLGLARWATAEVQAAAQLATFPPVLLGEIVIGIVLLSLAASAVAVRAALRIQIVEALR